MRAARTETRAWVCWTGRGSARLFVFVTGNASIRHTLIAAGAIGGRGRAHACKRSPGLQQQLPRGGALEFEAEFQVRVVVGATQEAEPRVQQARGDLCRATARFESSAQDWVATSLHRWVHNHTPTQALTLKHQFLPQVAVSLQSLNLETCWLKYCANVSYCASFWSASALYG